MIPKYFNYVAVVSISLFSRYNMVAALFSNVHYLTCFVLKRIPQHCPQRLSASKSCSESIDLYTKQSLANKRTAVPGSNTLGRSLMKNRKSSGPNTVLWGTFESTESTKWAPSITTLCDRPLRKDDIHWCSRPSIPYLACLASAGDGQCRTLC